MNKPKIPFIGRQDEINEIVEIARDISIAKVIFVSGDGGIGKTRLLQEIAIHFSQVPHTLVLDVFDLDDDRYKQPGNIGFAIANSLGAESFEKYFYASNALREAEMKRASQNIIKQKADEVNSSFTSCFNNVSTDQRVIIRIDTLDTLSDTNTLDYIFYIASGLKNVLILAAGRNANLLYDKYLGVYNKSGKQNISLIELQELPLVDAQKYILAKQKQLNAVLDHKLLENIYSFLDGKLVVFDLGIDWLQKNEPLEWMHSSDFSAITPKQKHIYQEQFYAAIIASFSQRRTDFDYLKLVLAVISPLSIEGIMYTLDVSQARAIELFEKAASSSIFKVLPDKRIKLHDEIERITKDYAWRQLDAEEDLTFIDLGIDFFEQTSSHIEIEIQNLLSEKLPAGSYEKIKHANNLHDKEGLYWSIRTRLLSFYLSRDVSKGYAFFKQEMDYVQDHSSGANHRRGLLSEIQPYTILGNATKDFFGEQLSEANKIDVLKLLAKESVFDGLYSEAIAQFDELIALTSKDEELYIELVIGKNNARVRLGQIKDALNDSELILQIAKNKQWNDWIIKLHVELGWINRIAGKLNAAANYYQAGLKLAIAQKDEKRMALIYNGLAYIHSLEHDHKAAMEISQAIAIWKRLADKEKGLSFRLGQTYNTAGAIMFELGRLNNAEEFFKEALDIFEKEEIEQLDNASQSLEWKSKARAGLGSLGWQRAVTSKEKREFYLDDAVSNLKWAVDNATHVDRIGMLNRLGEVYFLQKKYKDVSEVWLESYNSALAFNLPFDEFHNLTDLARLAFFYPTPGFKDINDFKRAYKGFSKRHPDVDYKVLSGLYNSYLGHLLLKRNSDKVISDAIEFYKIGFSILLEYSAYPPFDIENQLDFVAKEVLPIMTVDHREKFLDEMIASWQNDNIESITVLGFFEGLRF